MPTLPVMGETETSDGCVRTSPQEKLASGIVVYLMEELGDARLRTAQLKKYIQEAIELVEKSPERDKFFEIAGHLIHGIPDTAFKLDKALDAAALAAARLDYEEIKQNLKPEKADELEDVLQDVRLQYLKRRSNEGTMERPGSMSHSGPIFRVLREIYAAGMKDRGIAPDLANGVGQAAHSLTQNAQSAKALAGQPTPLGPPIGLLQKLADDMFDLVWHLGASSEAPKTAHNPTRNVSMKNAKEAANELVQLAQITEAEGKIPLARLARLIGILEGPQGRVASDMPKKAATFFRKMAETLQKETNPSRLRLAGVLRRVFADGMQMDAGTMLAAIYAQANSRQDVIDGFLKANPNMSQADAEKAGDMWEKHKDNFK